MAGAHRLGEPVGGMRALFLPAAALALAGAVVLAGGRMVDGPADPTVVERPGAADIALAEGPVAPVEAEATSAADAPAPATPVRIPLAPLESATAEAETVPETARGADASPLGPTLPLSVEPLKPTAASRLVAPAVVAPPQLGVEELQRDAPREPLSQLGLALPPPPPPEFKNPWAGKPLFRPVAVESAVFESAGHTIAIDGVKSVAADESCIHEGTSWPCGVRARAAFRLWLRSRALVCQIPEEERDEEVVRARCRLAKQDVGAWLVANGWARADPDGPYVQAEEKARNAKIGIFGSPPDTSSISAVPDAPVSATAERQPIMTEEGVDPQPSLGPQLNFPPPPPAP